MSFAFNKHRRRGDAGVTSLEVAVIFGVFIVLVFSIINLEEDVLGDSSVLDSSNICADDLRLRILLPHFH